MSHNLWVITLYLKDAFGQEAAMNKRKLSNEIDEIVEETTIDLDSNDLVETIYSSDNILDKKDQVIYYDT